MTAKESFKNGWVWLDRLWQSLGVIAALTCLTLMIAEILLRYILKKPLMGIEEITCMVAFWAYFMGAVHGAFEDSHIEAQVTHVFIKNRLFFSVVDVIKSFFTFIIVGYLSIWGIDYFIWGIQKNELSPYLLLPKLYSQSAISIGLVFMAIYFFSHFIRKIALVLKSLKRQ